MRAAQARLGPRRLDPHQQAAVQPQTVETYRREALKFSRWALANKVKLAGAESWDDALVEYKNDPELEEPLRKTHFVSLASAVVFFFPRHKGKLGWAHAVL